MRESLKMIQIVHHALLLLAVAILGLAFSPARVSDDDALYEGLEGLREDLEGYDARAFREWVDEQLEATTQAAAKLTAVLNELGILVEQPMPASALIPIELRSEFIDDAPGTPAPTLAELDELLRNPPSASVFVADDLEGEYRRFLQPFRHTTATLSEVRLGAIASPPMPRLAVTFVVSVPRSEFEMNRSRIIRGARLLTSVPRVADAGDPVRALVDASFSGQFVSMPSLSLPTWLQGPAGSDQPPRLMSPRGYRGFTQFRSMTVVEAQQEIDRRRAREAARPVVLLGLTIAREYSAVAAPAVALALTLYLLVHVRAVENSPPGAQGLSECPYVGLFTGSLSWFMTCASLLLPTGACICLLVRVPIDTIPWLLGWAIAVLNASGAALVIRSIHRLRERRRRDMSPVVAV